MVINRPLSWLNNSPLHTGTSEDELSGDKPTIVLAEQLSPLHTGTSEDELNGDKPTIVLAEQLSPLHTGTSEGQLSGDKPTIVLLNNSLHYTQGPQKVS